MQMPPPPLLDFDLFFDDDDDEEVRKKRRADQHAALPFMSNFEPPQEAPQLPL